MVRLCRVGIVDSKRFFRNVWRNRKYPTVTKNAQARVGTVWSKSARNVKSLHSVVVTAPAPDTELSRSDCGWGAWFVSQVCNR